MCASPQRSSGSQEAPSGGYEDKQRREGEKRREREDKRDEGRMGKGRRERQRQAGRRKRRTE